MRQRSFRNNMVHQRYLYGTASMLVPSCDPNCHISLQADHCICRVIVPIKAGDVLTATYCEDWCTLPTAERREKLLRLLDITCHCPRCDAPGDDTRQLKCFRSACQGFHMVRQPRLLVEPPGQHYDDVAFEEPHLLPCTVCQRLPPLEHQAWMLRTEQEQVRRGKRMDQQDKEPVDFYKIFERLNECRKQPISHMQTVEGIYSHQFELNTLVMGYTAGSIPGADKSVGRLMKETFANAPRILLLALSLESNFDLLQRVPTGGKYAITIHAVDAFAVLGHHTKAFALARRLLRAHRIREGRLDPSEREQEGSIVKALNAAMLQVPAAVKAVPEGCCVYCGESPEHAAMKRSRCGACEQAIYCGAACQKAHWALHKKECGK